RKDNFVVETADEEKGLVEAERAIAFVGIGENTLVLGPYAMNISYQNDTVVVNSRLCASVQMTKLPQLRLGMSETQAATTSNT
ncbi:MAG: hypothetical protein ACK42Y_03240, partial [Candidatus Thermochlorobacter sp.]